MDWTIPAHRHPLLYQFQLLDRGAVRASIDGQVMQVDGPAALMLAPGSVHGFTYSRAAVGHQITIPERTLAHLLGLSDLAEKHLQTSFVAALQAHAEPLRRLFADVAREYAGKEIGRAQTLLSLAAMIAVQLARIQGQQSERSAAPGMRDALAQRFLTLVEAHYAQQRALDFYAERLQVSADHLSRACKQWLRRSALNVLNDRLMLEARRLLAYTALPVARIADQLGYSDPAYFTRAFGRAMGHSPSHYRELIAQGVRAADV